MVALILLTVHLESNTTNIVTNCQTQTATTGNLSKRIFLVCTVHAVYKQVYDIKFSRFTVPHAVLFPRCWAASRCRSRELGTHAKSTSAPRQSVVHAIPIQTVYRYFATKLSARFTANLYKQ